MTSPALATAVVGYGPRLVLVHGFTQTRDCWGPVADGLAADHELVLVDAPGHGASAAVPATIETGAGLLAAVGGLGTYVGYSMGGRLALRAALDHPKVVQRLVLIGASPGLASDEERAARRFADEALADRLQSIGVDAFVDEWLASPLFAGLSDDARGRPQRRANTVVGLASSLLLAGTGAQEPLWDRLAELAMPVLLVTGEDDAKFGALNVRMADRIGPNATHVVVPGAGHTAHLEQPSYVLHVLRMWLATGQGTASGS